MRITDGARCMYRHDYNVRRTEFGGTEKPGRNYGFVNQFGCHAGEIAIV